MIKSGAGADDAAGGANACSPRPRRLAQVAMLSSTQRIQRICLYAAPDAGNPEAWRSISLCARPMTIVGAARFFGTYLAAAEAGR